MGAWEDKMDGTVRFDAASFDSDSSSPLTYSHTVANKDNRILVVSVQLETSDLAMPVVSGITYNSVALTKIDSIGIFTDGVWIVSELWYLQAPATGTKDVVVTTGGDWILSGAMSIYNAEQQAPEATAKNVHSQYPTAPTPINTKITTVTDGAMVLDSFGCGNNSRNYVYPQNVTPLKIAWNQGKLIIEAPNIDYRTLETRINGYLMKTGYDNVQSYSVSESKILKGAHIEVELYDWNHLRMRNIMKSSFPYFMNYRSVESNVRDGILVEGYDIEFNQAQRWVEKIGGASASGGGSSRLVLSAGDIYMGWVGHPTTNRMAHVLAAFEPAGDLVTDIPDETVSIKRELYGYADLERALL